MRLLIILLAVQAFAATYYIDYDGGANTNNGTAKATPWKSLPGMLGCSDTCASTTPQPGDNFILKGGVTWPNASLGVNWTWNGNATTASPGCTGNGCIYIGVDQTWYTGASWSRPKFDAEGSAVSTPDVGNIVFRIYANYVIIDNLEFTGVYWTGTPAFGTGVAIALATGTPGRGTDVEIKNVYIHGWSHGAGTENPCGVIGDTAIPNNNVNSIIHHSVIDGSDTATNSCSAIFGGPPYIRDNYIAYVTSGLIVNGTVSIDRNTVTNLVSSFDGGAHTNGIEINASRDTVVANNVIAHLPSGTLALWVAPNATYTNWVYNNLIYDTDVNNVLDLAAPVTNNGCENDGTYCTSGGTVYVWNNTVECGPDSNPAAVCAAGINAAIAAATIANNHFITSAAAPNDGVWSTNGITPTVTTNLRQSKATANGQGYTMAGVFVPTVGGSTIAAGTDLTAQCGTFPALCSDTVAGVTYDAVAHTVTANGRVAVARPNGSAWDIGAYQYQAGAPTSNSVTKGGVFTGGRMQ